MSLVRAERRRLIKRRFTRYMLLIGVLVLGAVAIGTFMTNTKVGPERTAAAQRDADRSYQEQLRHFERFKTECKRAQETKSADAKNFPPDCEELQPPSKEESANIEWFMPATFEFKKEFQRTIGIFAAILVMVGFVVGASYIGAEWNTGGMMNLLLWRPKRLQVFLTKLGTLLTGMLTASVVLGALWTAAFWLIATFRGTTAKMTSGTWQSLALTGTRAIALILIATTIGFAAASIGRHTAMALGAAIGVIVVGQFGLGIALGLANVKFVEAYLLPTYVLAWIDKKVKLENYRACSYVAGECNPETKIITWEQSSLLFGITTVVILAVALWTMRRRDIT